MLWKTWRAQAKQLFGARSINAATFKEVRRISRVPDSHPGILCWGVGSWRI